MSKVVLFAIIFICQIIQNDLFSQSWQWSRQVGSTQRDISINLVTDSNGDNYSAGIFRGPLCYFPGDTSNVSNGSSDFYLVKFDASGTLIWMQQFGGNNNSTCSEGVASLTIDAQDNLYVAGGYCGITNLGCGALSSQGFSDGLIAKFDASGNCLWANEVSSNMDDGFLGITLDDAGFVYVCGTNNNTANVSGFIVPPGGFIAKYDTSGNCLWVKHKISSFQMGLIGLNCSASPQSIKYSNGALTISGYFSNDTVTIDSTTIYSKMLYYYLASFDTSGNLNWVKNFGGPQGASTNFEHGIDDYGNIYVTGTSTGIGYFQNDTIVGPYSSFIVKFDSSGNELWVRGIISTIGSWGNMVSSDGDGNVYVTGKFRGNTTFGNFNVTAGSSNDMFIARYNSTGDCLGVRFFGEAEGFGVTQDNNGNAYVCGTFDNTVTIGGNTFTTYGDKDVFIAKLDEIVGIEEINGRTGNQLLIYANPNAGKCNITVPDEFANEQNLTLSIFNLQGQLIQQQPLKMHDGKIKVNLSAKAKGVYSVTLSNGTKVYYGKIVFE